MNVPSQMVAVTLLNLRTIPQRVGGSLVIVFGVGGVVAVLVSILAMSTGFRRTIEKSGHPDRAIVLARGADSEAVSSLSREEVMAIVDAPGIQRGTDGNPLASPEIVVIAPVADRRNGFDAFATMRGVAPNLFSVRKELKLAAGRMYLPAVRELIVGRAAQIQFVGVEIGDHVRLSGGDWTVVGVFSSNGSAEESGFIADPETMLSAYRSNSYNSVTVQLASASSFQTFKDTLTSNPLLAVDVQTESEYFSSMSGPINRILRLVVYLVGGIMAIGALVGALNTMYSAVSSRRIEIGILRAMGFSGGAVVTSILAEALLLSSVGAVLGFLTAYLLFNGNVMSTVADVVGNNPQLVYRMTVSPALGWIGVGLAFGIGIIGGAFPAARAARLSVAAALKTA